MSVKSDMTLNKKRVSIQYTPEPSIQIGLEVHALTPGLAKLLVAKEANLLMNQNPKYVADDLTTYRTLLNEVAFNLRTSSAGKANYIRNRPMGGAGSTRRGRTAPPTQSGKVGPDGEFGDYSIDLGQLGKGFLHVSDKKGTLILHQEASPGLRHLLTKHSTAKQAGEGLFLPGDLRQYHQLAEKAHLRLPKGGNRKALLDTPRGAVAFLPDDEKVLGERLKVLEGMRGAGDTSKDLVSEGVAIADRLLKKRWISKREHEERVRALLQ